MHRNQYTPSSLHTDLKRIGYRKHTSTEARWREIRRYLRGRTGQEKLGLCPRHEEHDRLLASLGLPADLLTLLEEGRLGSEVEKAYRLIDAMNDRLDAWEAANPTGAQALPWFESREAWKAAGRPRLDWWQALRLTTGMRQEQGR